MTSLVPAAKVDLGVAGYGYTWPRHKAGRTVTDAQARKLALRDPLGVGVILNYLRLKETETARLRLVARGKFYGVPRERLAEELGSA